MRLVKICDIADVNPSRQFMQTYHDELVPFVPMESVDEQTGTVRHAYQKPYGEVSKGYTYFENGDIIFAKITPCMQNGKSAIIEGLKQGFGFGSTEFIVIRPKRVVYRKWIFHFIRSKEFRTEAENNFSGSAGQQRVPVDFVKNKLVPLPDKDGDIERLVSRIETNLAHVEAMRQAALKQVEGIESLSAAILREAFDFGKDETE